MLTEARVQKMSHLAERVKTRTIVDKEGNDIQVVPKAEMKKVTQDFLKRHGFHTMNIRGRLAASTSVNGIEIDASLFGNAEYISEMWATQDGRHAVGKVEARFPSTNAAHAAPPGVGGIYTLEDYNYYAEVFMKEAEALMRKAK